MKKWIVSLFFLMLLPSVLAQSITCYNSTHKQIEKVMILNISGTTYDIKNVEYVYCPYGCDPQRNDCNYPPYIYLLIIISIIFLSYAVYRVLLRVMT